MEILEDTQDLRELTKAYANLGATITHLDFENGVKYHNKSIKMADKIFDIRIKGYGLMNIAYTFINILKFCVLNPIFE